jgi:hypothetical protein
MLIAERLPGCAPTQCLMLVVFQRKVIYMGKLVAPLRMRFQRLPRILKFVGRIRPSWFKDGVS